MEGGGWIQVDEMVPGSSKRDPIRCREFRVFEKYRNSPRLSHRLRRISVIDCGPAQESNFEREPQFFREVWFLTAIPSGSSRLRVEVQS